MALAEYTKMVASYLHRAAEECKRMANDQRKIIREQESLLNQEIDKINQQINRKEVAVLGLDGQAQLNQAQDVGRLNVMIGDLRRNFNDRRRQLEQDIQALEDQAGQFVSQANNYARMG